MQPSVGRIVHYVSYGTPPAANGTQAFTSECRAAVITDVSWSDAADQPDWKGDDQEALPGDEQARPYIADVDLFVMNPTGVFFNEHVDYDASAKPKGGTWHWPERVG